METLTKENFWNEMKQEYPKAVEHFCKWIDTYKQKNYWNLFFNKEFSFNHPSSPPKYHDLPIAIQFGIFLEYLNSLEEYTVQAVGINNPRHTISYHLSKINKNF